MRNIYYILCLTAVILITGCNHKQESVSNHHSIHDEVLLIDSINRVLIAERADSIPVVISSETGEPYSRQEILDAWAEASRSWKRFVHNIRTYRYDKASSYLLDENARLGILGHLRESELRSAFILNVVKELLYEYQNDDYLLGYLKWLYDEVLTEVSMNGIMDGTPHNVANTFTQLLFDYGITLSAAGYLDNALELVSLYYQANQYFSPDDELTPLFEQYFFKSCIYHVCEEFSIRDSIMQDLKVNILPSYGERGLEMQDGIKEIEANWAIQERESYGH